jgi:hypothetical protein
MKQLIFGAALVASTTVNALSVVSTNDGTTLVNALLGGASGITVDGAVNVIGLSTQSGTYTGFSFAGSGGAAPAIAQGNGIVLTSGTAVVPSSNTSASFGSTTGTGSSATIAALTGRTSYDQNRLAFNFTVAPGTTSISSSFVFGSDEFPEFAGTSFSDGFAFVVDGVNYAKFQDNSIVSLASLGSNANLYSNAGSPYAIEYDGLTPSLTVTGLLNPGVKSHTLEIVISDTGDSIYDSAVFLAGLKGGTSTGGGITPSIPEPETYALMLAGIGVVAFVARRRKGQA